MIRYKAICAAVFIMAAQGCANQSPVFYRSDFVIRHPLTGEPLAGIPYKITAPDGSIAKGITNKKGLTREAVSKTPGKFVVTLISPSEL